MFDELPEEVGPEERMRWETVVVEIVSNVIEHPVTPDHAVSVEVRLDVHPDRLDALIVDDAEPAAIPLTRAMPGAEAESGRGLALTQLLCDEFTYERRSERNRWRLVCLRGQLTDPAVS
jgi:serine/threonine-protein kinase RsbW